MGNAIKDITSFLNSYSGLILAVLTFFYVWFTFKILKSNKDLINVMREENEFDIRPYIVFLIGDRTDTMVYLQIKNIGRSAAQEVQISVEPDFKLYGSLHNLSEIALLKKGILFFPPGSEYTICLGNYSKFLDTKKGMAILPNVLNCKCEYQFKNKKYDEKSIVDIRSQAGTELSSNPIANEINVLKRDIIYELRQIGNTLDHFKLKEWAKMKKEIEDSKKTSKDNKKKGKGFKN